MNNCTLSGNSACGYSYVGYVYYCCCQNGEPGDGQGHPCWIPASIHVPGSGGGASSSTLNNCTLSGNSADYAGGATNSILNNSIAYFNAGGNYSGCTLNYCCTTPHPNNGVGNIASAPLFADTNGWANLRLQSNSPCINAGNNAYAPTGPDLDGNPRIAGGTVDIGAYEFQSPVSTISYAWLQQYGLPINSSTDTADPDGDGMNSWQEWIAGTDPTDAASALRLLTPIFTPPGLLLRWNSDTNHAYFVQRATTLGPPPIFSLLRTNVPGQFGTTMFIDTTPPPTGAAFYRIGTDSSSGSPPLWLEAPVFVPASVVIAWTSVTNRTYFLERSTNLAALPAFTPLATNIPGQPGTTGYTDTNAVGSGQFFYRVGLVNP